MKVSLISLNQSWENKSENQSKILDVFELIFRLKKQHVDLVIFPEMTLTGFTMNSNVVKERLPDSQTIEFFKKCALDYQTNIAFGVVIEREQKAMNCLIVVSSKGEILANYAKIHPFSYANENEHYVSGNDLVSCQIQEIPIGLTICYDLRFPELYQGLSKKNKVIINIANWPERRVTHWNTLLNARAIENQVFMIGVNRIGRDANGLTYKKSSQIFSPIGEELKGESLSEQIDIYDISISEVDRYRQDFPVKNDRKIELYKNIL
ncbi:nitrilase-related carbon-nitrogen hydrolase [Capnocytophaga felis]|uniref:Amidohydrolase n=1 Tax=Capnocytophaga felis TaxID=2267611 RepID=A0A5M4B6P8_9FLAO|nr:nitrilase-related carbon-nitrogen hydrolase [Capnocytophaga felis]GET45281.1 amidohydrolase [Capnocytophaga felis]GET47556.1 amidohydrolase [Capnocytophaga felis]